MPAKKHNYWDLLRHAAQRPSEPFGFGSPDPSLIKPTPVAPPPAWTSIDLLFALKDIQSTGVPLDQALVQRMIPADLAVTTQGLLSAVANRAWNRPRAPAMRVPTSTPSTQMELLRVNAASALHPKYAAALSVMERGSAPTMTDQVWEAWLASTHGRYVRVRPDYGSVDWLSYLLQIGLPQDHVRLCFDFKDLSTAKEVRSLINEAATSVRAFPPHIKLEDARFNTCRGKCYLLVSLPDEPRSSASGPAFSSSGLRAIMLALFLHSKLTHFIGGTSR